MLHSLLKHLRFICSSKKLLLKISLCGLISLALVSCAKKPQQPLPSQKITVKSPVVIRQEAVNQLMQMGIMIQHVGQNITIVVPSDKIFTLATANYIYHSDAYFKAILKYMKTYNIVEVNVSGYTDNLAPRRVALALTERQAQRVSNLLWSGFPALRIIVAKGFGVLHPVASNQSSSGQSQNRRIEIHFRYLLN